MEAGGWCRAGEPGGPGLGSEHRLWDLTRGPGGSSKAPPFPWSGVGHSLGLKRAGMSSTASQDAWGPSTAPSKVRCSGGFCKGLCLEKWDLFRVCFQEGFLSMQMRGLGPRRKVRV